MMKDEKQKLFNLCHFKKFFSSNFLDKQWKTIRHFFLPKKLKKNELQMMMK